MKTARTMYVMHTAQPKVPIRRLAALALSLLTALALWPVHTAHAQESPELPAIQTQRFRPAPGPADVLNLFSSPVMEHLDWHFGGYLDVADAPLEIATGGDLSSEEFRQTVDTQATLSLFLSLIHI